MKNSTEQDAKTLLSVFDEDLNRLKKRVGKDRSENTWKAMKLGRNYVAGFLKEKLGREDILMQELSPQFIHDFSVYLSADKELRSGTVWFSCQHLKGIVARAHWRGIISWNPFATFHIAKNIRPREYLTEEELVRLIKYPFKKEQLCFARDIFIFAAFTGLSFIDIKELRSSDIKNINGSAWIVSQRHKTRVSYQVKLLDIPLQILRRYQNPEGGRVFAPMEYRTMAKRILKIMEEVGISKHITMHCARHSFAILALNKGMPIESVSRILGHTNITTTQIYAKITLQKLSTDMENFEKELHL